MSAIFSATAVAQLPRVRTWLVVIMNQKSESVCLRWRCRECACNSYRAWFKKSVVSNS